MIRPLLALAVALALSACGGGPTDGPALKNMDDACAIAAQRPDYLKAMRKTERRWGVPVAVQMATIYQESRFDGRARTPQKFALGVIPMGRQSSAYGYSQALDGTWEEYQKAHGGRRARRDNIHHATDFMGWYMDLTQRELGITKSDAQRQYLAYHEGRSGYRRGSYRQKAWLMRVSSEVASRAVVYDLQLRSCS